MINNPRVSRQHCALIYDGDTLLVTDLGSSNGTWVNGEPLVGSRQLEHGDVVNVGLEHLEIQRSDHEPTRGSRETERDLPIFRQVDDESEQSVTQVHRTSIALIETLVANGAASPSPAVYFERVCRAVETCLDPRPTDAELSPSDLRRLADAVRATVTLDASPSAHHWRDRTLAHPRIQLAQPSGSAPRPRVDDQHSPR